MALAGGGGPGGGVFSLVPAGAQAAAAGGTWGTAEPVQGLPALSSSSISSMSCASPGNCSAGGYLNSKSRQQAFVVSQVNGKWGDAQKVPGQAALNTIGVVKSVSCAAPGICTAGGYFVRPPGTGLKAFVVIQRNGTWGKARQIRRMSEIDSLSCATPSNCSAGGDSFTVSKINGSWGKAEEVPGLANLSRGGGHAHIESLSCAAPGNCAAGGFIGGNGDHAFLASQTDGTWGAAGTCAAVGSNNSPPGHIQGFVISEDNGTWGTAIDPPGLAALNTRGVAQINAVSCATADNCAAGGTYADSTHGPQAFTISQTTTPAP